jgi:hypothetical protein
MRILAALGLTLAHLFLQAQLPASVPKESVPEAPAALAQAGPSRSILDKYKVNYKRFTRGKQKPVQDEAAGRQEWFRKRMGGDLKPEFARRLVDEAARERATNPSQFPGPGLVERPLAAAGNTWVSLGPTRSDFTQNGPIKLTKVDSGRLRAILPDTADASGNTIYVLAAGGGLWKTTTFQSAKPSWTALTDFVGSNMSGAVAFGTSTSTLYVGAGDPFDSGVGGFIVKSTDGGRSWGRALSLGKATKVLDIKVDTSQSPEMVLAGTDVGLFRSSDGGASFSPVTTMAGRIWSIVSTSEGWLASMVDTSTDETKAGKGSVWLSPDRGVTWKPTLFPAGSGRTTLAIGKPGEDSVVYAYAAVEGTEPKAQKDLFRSLNGGANWDSLNINGIVPTNWTKENDEQPDMNLMHEQAWFNQMILVDPLDTKRNTVYLGGSLLSAKTVDGGKTWTLTSNWLAQFGLPYVHADFHCAAYSNFNGKPRIYFGTDGGLFISDNGGSTWDDSKNEGLVNHLIFSLAANPGVAGSALVGLQDNGTRTRAGTTSTFNQVTGGDGLGVAWAQDVRGATAVSMASYIYNAIYRSTTSPVTKQDDWASFTSGLGLTGQGSDDKQNDNGASYYFVTPIITPPSGSDKDGQTFFTYGGNGKGPNAGKIFKSSATGWTAIGTPGKDGISEGRAVSAVSHGIGVSPLDLQHIAAAGLNGCLLLTENGGTTWKEILLGYINVALGTPIPIPGAVEGWKGFTANIAWADNKKLYICSESTEPGAAHVAKSTNGGDTWNRVDAGLPDIPVTKLVVDLGDATGNTVYAATWLGVYRTTSGGASWSLFGTGLPQCRVTDIWVAPDSSTVRVSTWGRGVWELQAPVGAPTITSLNPASGVVGTPVTLTGTAFSGASAVGFNGTATLFSVISDTSISTVVPAGATTGNITVTTPAGTGTSASAFTVTVPGPAITSFNPPSGLARSVVTLTGTGFTGASSVKFNGTAATFAVISDTSLSTTVPNGATTGTLTVTTPLGTGTSSSSFTIKTRDFNGDGITDVLDLATLVRAYGSVPSSSHWNPAADLTGDGVVDDLDLALFLAGM